MKATFLRIEYHVATRVLGMLAIFNRMFCSSLCSRKAKSVELLLLLVHLRWWTRFLDVHHLLFCHFYGINALQIWECILDTRAQVHQRIFALSKLYFEFNPQAHRENSQKESTELINNYINKTTRSTESFLLELMLKW